MADGQNQNVFWGQFSYNQQQPDSDFMNYEPAYDVSSFGIQIPVSLDQAASVS